MGAGDHLDVIPRGLELGGSGGSLSGGHVGTVDTKPRPCPAGEVSPPEHLPHGGDDVVSNELTTCRVLKSVELGGSSPAAAMPARRCLASKSGDAIPAISDATSARKARRVAEWRTRPV